jgi:hypothetical protein
LDGKTGLALLTLFGSIWREKGIPNNSVKNDWLTNFQQKTMEKGRNREGNGENNNSSLMDIKG